MEIPHRCTRAGRSSAALFLGLWLAGCGGGSDQTAPKDSPLVINTPISPPTGTATYAYAGYQFGASGGSPPLVWSLSSGQLPFGLTLDSGGNLTGTPTRTGSSTFTLKVMDSAPTPESVVTASITTTISAPVHVKIDPTQTPPSGTNGAYYGFAFAAIGGYLPLRWSLTAGSVPPGLTLGSDGTLTGTPTTAGTSKFTIMVTDSGTPQSSDSLATSLTIANPVPPVVATTEPPTATVNIPYGPLPFTANGGLAPLVWSESGTMGGLGLSLDGILSGTPTTAGHFPITVTVRDAFGRSSPDTQFTVRVSLSRPGAFAASGSLHTARHAHAATLLADGRCS